ncbi:hypothetical protein GQ53DRAFT_642807 [Thozetella sp. PMI_491]|nr:hypothetical protein GQ53DRAFT_642807 [Thozetella sp. PMI_491]
MDDLGGWLLAQIKALRPSFMGQKPHFNFISAHYFWIISLAIIGSVIIFGAGKGNIAYIDALFFAVGCNTQAGLNTVDVNNLNTFQQVVIFLLPMLSNPITINTFVVFLRLYWFERRFQHVVREARQRRRTISRSLAKAQSEPSRVERGVNGRDILVMHNGRPTRITNDGIVLVDSRDHYPSKDRAGPANGHTGSNGVIYEEDIDPIASSAEERRPEIKFAETVKRSDGFPDDTIKLPPARTDEEHIAILERQRNGDDEVLRIPGPREAERGALPSRVQLGEAGETEPEPASPRLQYLDLDPGQPARPLTPAENRPQTITIAEPERRRPSDSSSDDIVESAKSVARVFTFLRLRKPRKGNQKLHHEQDQLHTRPSIGRRRTLETVRTAFSRDKEDMAPYLSWQPTLGRNSAFPDLSEEQREELGGIEYRSLKTLALILTCYFWGFSILGVIILLPWILRDDFYGAVVDNAGQSRVWWGFFTPSSSFMDLGFTLTPDSMNSFNTAVLPLFLMSFLIIIGNTGFPIMLRFIIWVTSLYTPPRSGLWEELRFLLDHPRRCFTLLFPSGATWWLFWLLVILNLVDLIFFIILDLGPGIVTDLSPGIRVLDGIFQAASTRTAGFSCVNLAALHPGVQVSYMIMMYISVFPIAISVRRTNVYEEKSLGIYNKNETEEHTNSTDLSYVGMHLRRQLSFDLCLGYSTVNASLSSQFTVVGKLVIIAMMIRGRHRGLPYGLDRAILLPSESLLTKETADANARMVRQASHLSITTNRRPRSRSRSLDRRNSNLITSLLHPGPAPPSETLATGLQRRSTDPGSEDENPQNTRVLPRRAETALH